MRCMKSEQRSQAFLRKKKNDARITVTGNTLFNNGILGPGRWNWKQE